MEKLIAKPIYEPPMSRESIIYVQLTLNEMGFDAGKPDGMAGPKTRNATRQYQLINGIPADGYVGQTLLKQLTPADK